ncbi:MAG: hypothetical protein IPN43_00035 [Chitinophagaceae bacterium]|nr:hypothetical protein [Chitinophagaceae bacterium]
MKPVAHIQVLLLLNFACRFFLNTGRSLFEGCMYQTNALIVLQKNILNLGVYLDFFVVYRLVEKCEHLAGIFYVDVIGVTGYVLYDFQRQLVDVLFSLGAGNHSGGSYG